MRSSRALQHLSKAAILRVFAVVLPLEGRARPSTMLTESHIAKFRRLHTTLERLDPVADREMWIWTAMNAGVHLLNAALHRSGITDEVDSFHSQLDGLYVVPDRLTGILHDALHAPGDVMHVNQPPLALSAQPRIARGAAALQVLEDLREPYVRGCGQPPEASEAAWQAAYGKCVGELSAALGIESAP